MMMTKKICRDNRNNQPKNKNNNSKERQMIMISKRQALAFVTESIFPIPKIKEDSSKRILQ